MKFCLSQLHVSRTLHFTDAWTDYIYLASVLNQKRSNT